MSGGGSGGGTQVVKQDNVNPYQQPYLSDGYQIARQLLATDAARGNPQFYPGATYTPATSMTERGINSMYGRAEGTGVTNARPAEQELAQQAFGLLDRGAAGAPGYTQQLNTANMLAGRGAAAMPGYGTLSNTANGRMLGRNPEFQGMVSRAIEAARPGVDSAFAAGGRLGSGAHAAAFSDAATRIAGDLAYQDYGRERQNQMSAAGLLQQNDLAARTAGMSGLDSLGLRDIQARQLGGALANSAIGNDRQNIQDMLTAGGIRESYMDQALADRINRFNWNNNKPWMQLERYMGVVNTGNPGLSSTSTRPIYNNSTGARLASGAAGGAATGMMIGGPWGAAIGGVGGGLLSVL